MTALVLRALKTLPDEYVRDGTQVCEYNGRVVVVNGTPPALPVMQWMPDSGWSVVKFVSEKTRVTVRPVEA